MKCECKFPNVYAYHPYKKENGITYCVIYCHRCQKRRLNIPRNEAENMLKLSNRIHNMVLEHD